MWSAFLVAMLLLIYWAIALLVYGAWKSAVTHGPTGLTPFDIRAALLFSAGFMVLSGYPATTIPLHAFLGYRKSWMVRAVLNTGLFFVHFYVFSLVVGDSDIGLDDFPFALLGVAGVIAADATAGLILVRPSERK